MMVAETEKPNKYSKLELNYGTAEPKIRVVEYKKITGDDPFAGRYSQGILAGWSITGCNDTELFELQQTLKAALDMVIREVRSRYEQR